jgi:hypothetical protein
LNPANELFVQNRRNLPQLQLPLMPLNLLIGDVGPRGRQRVGQSLSGMQKPEVAAKLPRFIKAHCRGVAVKKCSPQ